jgi:hypothetical protein
VSTLKQSERKSASTFINSHFGLAWDHQSDGEQTNATLSPTSIKALVKGMTEAEILKDGCIFMDCEKRRQEQKKEKKVLSKNEVQVLCTRYFPPAQEVHELDNPEAHVEVNTKYKDMVFCLVDGDLVGREYKASVIISSTAYVLSGKITRNYPTKYPSSGLKGLKFASPQFTRK